MARFLAAKQFGSLRPVDEGGQDALRKIGNGELVMIEMKLPRNVSGAAALDSRHKPAALAADKSASAV